MKTVGQIIKAARQKRSLTVDQLSSLTKIDSKYIEALELDRYVDLPSETFAKGFIRNLSLRLDLNPSELIAIFRRDFRQPDRGEMKIIHRKTISGIPSQVLPFVFGGLIFIIYLIFQFRAILTPPKLEIIKPTNSSVLVSPIEIEGDTSIDANISIGEDTQVKPDTEGHFFARINLPVGETILDLKATNRFSRTTEKQISVTIISK